MEPEGPELWQKFGDSNRQILEGHRNAPVEDKEQEHNVAVEDPNKSSEDEKMADESSIAEQYRQNTGPEASEEEEADAIFPKPLLDPLELRSPIASQSDRSEEQTRYSHDSEHLSTPDENVPGHDDPEQEDQNDDGVYSPSIYPVRTSSSVEDRDSEKRRFEENLEQERLEQEYGPLGLVAGQNEPLHSPDIREHITGPEAVEEEVEYLENPGREQHDSALSADEEQVHHELVTPTHQNPSESGQIGVIGFTF
ncbi:hypothetical protein N7467_004242 [Penicillium canescens]|nr:hypothetical protein N7467_004242 [Penicillium canescens]